MDYLINGNVGNVSDPKLEVTLWHVNGVPLKMWCGIKDIPTIVLGVMNWVSSIK